MQSKVEICGVNTAKLKVLKNEETRALLIRAKAGDMAAREELIAGNLRLVLSVIQRFSGRGENVDDLFQVGCIGLIKAIDHFDVDQQVKFSTYGVPMDIGRRNRAKGGFSMTRKQALSLAIQALSESEQNGEAIEVLHTLSEELPLNHWSEAAIRDAVEQFILDNGRVPTATDFKKRGLPPHPVIRRRFGLPLREWLQENYPVHKPPEEERRAEATEAFKAEYLRIRPRSAEEFDAERSPGVRCWYTVAVYNHTSRWRSLLEKLALPVYSRRDPPREPTAFTVSIHTHFEKQQNRG